MGQIALRKTAQLNKDEYSQAAEVLTNNVYMDDIFESVDTVKEAQRLTKEMDEVLKTGGFSIKGWISNKMLTEGVKPDTEKGISVCEGEVEKVLGTTWNCKTDKFHFEVRASLLKVIKTPHNAPLKMTKRMIRSQVAQIYDPIGLPAAFIVKAKIGVQQLWQLGVEWDEDLPPTIQRKWISLFQEMKELEKVSLERCLLAANCQEAPVLCVFADASQEAFGTCMYVRQKRSDDVYNVKFIAAKSRVVPLRQLTTPRLELQAAVLASRLAKSIQVESRIQFGKVYFFTDSTITLAWIQSPSRNFKPFVLSRIGEIQSDTDPRQWRHIPGEDNVADDLSRGISVNELSKRWMKGPEFLCLPQEQWPNRTPPPPKDEDMEHCQTKLAVSVATLALTRKSRPPPRSSSGDRGPSFPSCVCLLNGIFSASLCIHAVTRINLRQLENVEGSIALYDLRNLVGLSVWFYCGTI